MAAGSNSIEFRIVNQVDSEGQITYTRWQVRTKEVVASVLGLIPLASSWSAWQDIDITTVTESI